MKEVRTSRVVIVGGGVAGSELACGLGRAARSLARSGVEIHVTLIDIAFSHQWKPLLNNVAAGSASAQDIECPFGLMASDAGFSYMAGRLSGLDRDKKRIVVSIPEPVEGRSASRDVDVEYDTLVIAVGSRVDTHRTPGVMDNCVMIQSTADAEAFKKLLLQRLQRARNEDTSLTIAVIGGGVASIELAAQIVRFAQSKTGSGTIPCAEQVSVVLIEESPNLSELVSARIAELAVKRLLALGISVVSGCRVRRVFADRVELSDGQIVGSNITVWAAGFKAPDELADLDGLEVNRSNQLMVIPTLQSTSDAQIYAIGDCSCLAGPGGALGSSPTAWMARDHARHLLKQLPLLISKGVPVAAFSPGLWGSSPSAAVMDAYGVLFRSNLLGSPSVRGRSGQIGGGLLRLRHTLALQGRWRGCSLRSFGFGM